jgi:hypothetical protein
MRHSQACITRKVDRSQVAAPVNNEWKMKNLTIHQLEMDGLTWQHKWRNNNGRKNERTEEDITGSSTVRKQSYLT